jgi:putative addiction module component (TIGR02574 family)
MKLLDIRQEALQLSVEERLELAETLWESLDRAPRQLPIPDWQRQLLDERIAEDDQEIHAGSPWPEVKRRILTQL